MKIYKYPNPVLRQKAVKIEDITPKIKQLGLGMKKIMEKNDGIGLAAPQVGKGLRIITINLEPDPEKKPKSKIFINPEIIEKSAETITQKEGCLSFPNLFGDVLRHKKIKTKFQNIYGKKMKFTCKDLMATVFQHEIDHLDGILLIDKVIPGTLKEIKPEPKIKKINAIFCGTPQFSVTVLKYLYKYNFPIKSIITNPDKKAGRGQIITSPPLKIAAKKLNIPVFQPNNTDQFSQIIKEHKPDLIITAASGFIVPFSILSTTKYGILNIHPSLLPKYRGPSPISSAILDGQKETGVSIIKLDEQIDHGPIVAQKKVEINANDTTKTLSEKLARLSAKLLVKILPYYINDMSKIIPQNHSKATYTEKLIKERGKIDWNKSAFEIERHIRAMHPWPQAFTFIDNKRLIIQKAHLENNKLILDLVQLEGKKPVLWTDFKKCLRDKKPDWLKKIKL